MSLLRRGPRLVLLVERTELAPGDEVRASVTAHRLGDRSQDVRVELQYVNRYTHAVDGDVGTSSTGIKRTAVTVAGISLPPRDDTVEVVLRVPDDAPPTAEDSVRWRLRATVDRHRARDVVEDVDLVMHSAAGAYADRLLEPVQQPEGFTAQIDVDRRDLRPGDVVRGTTTVVADQPLDGPGLYAWVHGIRRGEGGTTRSYGGKSLALAEPVRMAAGVPQRYSFEVRVPEDARPTFVAQHSSLEWYVEVGIPRRLVEDRVARLPVVVRR